MYQFCEETTFHGINHIEETKPRCLKFFWPLAFLCAFISCSALCVGQVLNFLNLPTSTEFRLKPNKSLQLPHPVICTDYHFVSSKIEQLNISLDLLEALKQRSKVRESTIFSDAHPGYSDSTFKYLLKKTEKEFVELKKKLNISDYR